MALKVSKLFSAARERIRLVLPLGYARLHIASHYDCWQNFQQHMTIIQVKSSVAGFYIYQKKNIRRDIQTSAPTPVMLLTTKCRCRINENLQAPLWNEIKMIQPDISKLDDKGKFCYLISNSVPRTLLWFGIYVYHSFNVRNEMFLEISNL